MLFELLESVGLQDTLRALREELERKKKQELEQQQLQKGKVEEEEQLTEEEIDKREQTTSSTSNNVIEQLEAKVNLMLSNVEGNEIIKAKSYNRNNSNHNNNDDDVNDYSDNYTEALTENKSHNDVNVQPVNLSRANGHEQEQENQQSS